MNPSSPKQHALSPGTIDDISSRSSHDGDSRSIVSRARPVPGPRRAGSNSNLASSYNRPPARSFVTQGTVNIAEHAQYSSIGVREDTAELAVAALAASPTRPSARRPSDPASGNISGQRVGGKDVPHLSYDPGRPKFPEVIEETSEPSTPAEHPDTSPTGSILTSLLHQSPTLRRTKTDESASEQVGVGKGRYDAAKDAGSTERTPLLSERRTSDAVHHKRQDEMADLEGQGGSLKKQNQFQKMTSDAKYSTLGVFHTLTHPKSWSARAIWRGGIMTPVSLLPCVFLGLLLNVLDALSYGMILFPLGEQIFAATGPDGISMFYVSCIVSQLVYSLGGSIFKGAVGSEMIEVVPFFHKMVYTIMAVTGKSRPDVVLATTITSYALSAILTGVVFFTLGAFKLGSLVNFFPRHILIGCIGGVGFFLFVTGIEVSARLEGNLEYNLATAKQLFRSDTVALWMVPLALSIFLIVVQNFYHRPWVLPAFFIGVTGIFYIVVTAVSNLNLPLMRDKGWIFPRVETNAPFYHFYTYYDFAIVDWKAVGATVPAMFALTFFGILHVPINVPALGIAAEEDDLNLNRELVAHGISNALSGFCGSIQNYLVYANSVMFIENGGNNRLAGILLAAATFAIWIAGPGMIGYVPIMVVGTLIYYLGIELLKEAVYDTWSKMHRLEYLTVIAIVLIMGVYDFVAGIFAGIVMACLSFVVQTSQRSAIRASYSGQIVESTVRRHPIQRRFLHEVGHQIYVTKLAGFLFFGSIVKVEKRARALIAEEAFKKEPVRYLVFDLEHVSDLDYSAAEAFTRMERVLGRRGVRVVVSGVEEDHEVGRSLQNVGLWHDESSVKFFENLNMALEYCENELLKAFYSRKEELDSLDSTMTLSLDVPKPETGKIAPSVIQPHALASPRQQSLDQAATTTLGSERSIAPRRWQTFKQPLPLILQTFQELTDKNEDFWFKAVPYFVKQEYAEGTVLFSQGEKPNGFYILQTGILHADYKLPVGTYHESIVAGTTCGELPFFSDTPRTATVFAERDCQCWLLSQEQWQRMQDSWPEGAREILRIALKLTRERVDAVTSYVLTTAG